MRAATKGGGLVCNIGTGRETSVNTLFREMAAQAGVEAEPEYQPLRPGELQPATASTRPGPGSSSAGRPWTELGSGTAATVEFVRHRLTESGGSGGSA